MLVNLTPVIQFQGVILISCNLISYEVLDKLKCFSSLDRIQLTVLLGTVGAWIPSIQILNKIEIFMFWRSDFGSFSNGQFTSTVGTQLPDMSGNWMVKICWIAEWFDNWMPFSYRTISLVTEWSCDKGDHSVTKRPLTKYLLNMSMN